MNPPFSNNSKQTPGIMLHAHKTVHNITPKEKKLGLEPIDPLLIVLDVLEARAKRNSPHRSEEHTSELQSLS
jgi:hypothetical protein